MPQTQKSVPILGVDFDWGDRVRVQGEWGSQRFPRRIDVGVRVWDTVEQIDKNGVVQVTLGLAAS